MTIFFQVLLDGLLNGMLYALVAAGLSMIFGVMDVINFAHGAFLMIAMYVGYWAGTLLGLDPLISWIISAGAVFLLAALTYRFIIRHIIGKSVMLGLVATFGLAMVLKNLCLSWFSPNFKLLSETWLSGKTLVLPGNVIIAIPQLVTAVFAIAVVSLLFVMIKRPRLGWAIQATAMDKDAAELMGINTEWIYILVFGIGGACVGVAGGLMPMYMAVHPEVGRLFGLIAFICVAMGGFGSIFGALVAALLVGLVESFAGFYIAPVFKYIAVFGLYLVVVTFRPRGLFGW